MARWVSHSPQRRLGGLLVLIALIAGCDQILTPLRPKVTARRANFVLDDSSWGDTAKCLDTDFGHCPLNRPDSIQSQTLSDAASDIFPECGWMSRYLTTMILHGNINLYAGWGQVGPGVAVADNHFPVYSPTYDRIHINSTDNSVYIHWVVRHEAAHSYMKKMGITDTEDRADSIANACWFDQKPY